LDAYAPLLAQAGVPAPARAPLTEYLGLLARWSERVNLTGARSPEERVAVLIEPALAMLPHLLPGALLDVGSGNGGPGLVLALLEPGRTVTLLEPRGRRWAFLREAARSCGRPDVDVRRERHEHYAGPACPNVTVRALRVTRHELDRLLAPGGQALLSSPIAGTRELGQPGRPALYAYRRST
jgi:16S rRNA (guanine527-N7)-methyltransferase